MSQPGALKPTGTDRKNTEQSLGDRANEKKTGPETIATGRDDGPEAKPLQTAGDRADAAVQMNEEDLRTLATRVAHEPRFRDQTVQVPASRLPSHTKRCVLTMDGYSYVIGECTTEILPY